MCLTLMDGLSTGRYTDTRHVSQFSRALFLMTTPTAFIVMPYQEPYETVYKSAVQPVLSKFGFGTVRADEVPGSRPFLDDIERDIARSDIVIVEATEANKNVYFELGLAIALKKEIILLTSNASSLPSDTRHIRHLVYSPDKMDDLVTTLGSWVERTSSFQLSQRRESAMTLNRGELVPDILDATVFLEKQVIEPSEDILRSIRAGSLINPKYIYSSDRGTNLWLKLCSDPEYVFFGKSVEVLRSFCQEILKIIPNEIIKSSPDIISLGPGNGIKDRVILSALTEHYNPTSDFGYYYPFDISPSMLTQAVRAILDYSDFQTKIKVKAAIADFGTSLIRFAPMYQYRPETNIFLLLGNALGNFEGEVTVLEKIKNAMFPGDYMLLEVRTGTSEDLDLGGSAILNKQFDFNPLHRLGVRYDDNKMVYSQRTSLSQIEGTKTVVASYRDFKVPASGESFDSVHLSYIHEYRPNKIAEAIKALDFSILSQRSGDGFHYYLLQNSS